MLVLALVLYTIKGAAETPPKLDWATIPVESRLAAAALIGFVLFTLMISILLVLNEMLPGRK